MSWGRQEYIVEQTGISRNIVGETGLYGAADRDQQEYHGKAGLDFKAERDE